MPQASYALDVPLLPCELNARPSVVCVTGVTGYVASAICARLLASGHTVHGTVRDLRKVDLVAPLKQLPGATQRLKLFQASLTEEGSFDSAVSGCDYVMHVASPFTLTAPKGKAKEALITPAVKGVETVLGSVNRTPTVKRVVLTSSTVAIHGDLDEHKKGYVYTEQDWNISSLEDVNPYPLSKVLAEKRANEIHSQQTRWQLVTINPSAVFGPPLGSRADGQIVKLVMDFCNGKLWPAGPAFAFGTVDLRDVAAAHCAGMCLETASGRYLVTNKSLDFLEIARVIEKLYPGKYRLPKGYLPLWMMLMVGPFMGFSRKLIRAMWGKVPLFDASRARNELGLQFLPMERALKDMIDRMIALKMLK